MQRGRAWAVWTAVFVAGTAAADTIEFVRNGQEACVEGNVLGVFTDKIWFEGRDTQHFILEKSALLQWDKSRAKLPLYSSAQLRAHLRRELGAGFYIHKTPNYMIVYNCTSEYAEQAGELLERTRKVFVSYFRNKGGFRFVSPRQPLIAIIYHTRDQFAEAIRAEIPGMSWNSGLYSHHTNRIYMYERDSSVRAPLGQGAGARTTSSAAGSTPGTKYIDVVIHEGIHQLAYNTGFHKRYAFNPVWFVEGMAMYFQYQMRPSAEEQSTATSLDHYRMRLFGNEFAQLEKGFLADLVVNDEPFRDRARSAKAYARAWALTYYLMRSKTRSYASYVRLLNNRPQRPYPADERLADFRKAFGKSPDGLEMDFRRYMAPIVTATR